MSKRKNNVTHKLRRFLNTIELLIHDLTLEIDDGKKLKIYFDAVDIVRAIEGIPTFYDYDFDNNVPSLLFNRDIFNSRRTLVNSLAISGMLGTIHLLLPHQGELSVRVKSLLDFGTNLKIRPDELAKRFLQDTEFTEVEWEKIADKEISSKRVKEIINQIPSKKAKVFFKAVQCLQPWHSRLLDIIKEGTLETINHRVHYQPAGMFELIFDLKEALEKRRPSLHRSNITDSLAIGALIEKVNYYKSGKSNEIPCFFISEHNIWQKDGQSRISRKPNVFTQIVNDSKFSHYFCINDDTKVSAIRNDEYFIFRATFVDKQNVKNSLDQLCNWSDEINTLLKTPNLSEIDKKLEEVKSKTDDLRSWAYLIEEIENDSFFNEIWLQSEAPTKFSKAVIDIVEASEKVKNLQIIKARANNQLKQIVRNWERQTAVFKDILSMWEKLGNRIRRWKKTEIFYKSSDEEIEQEIFKEFGFFRYSFPEETRKTITSHLRELLQNKNSEKEARKRFLFAYVSSLEVEDIDKTTLSIVISTLLVMENNINLKALLQKHINPSSSNKVHFSFRIVYGKLLLDLDRNCPIRKTTCREVKDLIKTLINEFSQEKEVYEKARLARGISYLYYWLWIGKGGDSAWRKPLTSKFRKDSELQEYIDDAIDYAKKSWVILEKVETENFDNKQKRLLNIEKTYALNMYLYHLVEDNRMIGERKKEIYNIGNLLESYRKNEVVWQYRYEDTLAVYYAKMALMENPIPKRKEYIGIAEMRVKNAIKHIKKVYGMEALDGKDRDVKEHLEEIRILKFRIYNP